MSLLVFIQKLILITHRLIKRAGISFHGINNTDRENFTFYAKDQAYAVLIATNMPYPEDS